MTNLTPREKKILLKGLDKGYLGLFDFYSEYKSKQTVKDTISRFLMLGLIHQDIGNKFKIDKLLIEEVLK